MNRASKAMIILGGVLLALWINGVMLINSEAPELWEYMSPSIITMVVGPALIAGGFVYHKHKQRKGGGRDKRYYITEDAKPIVEKMLQND